jgi:hypothetical protein
MSSAVAIVRAFPLALVGRGATTLLQVAVAAVILSASVVIGHDLREWRAWYWDPSTTHPWAPTPSPAERIVAVPSAAARLAAAATPVLAVAPAAATPTPACRLSTGSDLLVFVNPVASGADCVWLTQQADGTHVVVGTAGAGTSDLGVVELLPSGTRVFATMSGAKLDVYAPPSWQSPVVTVVGPSGTDTTVVVFTWQGRRLMPLLRTTGKAVDVTSDPAGWPSVRVARSDGAKLYAWDGRGFIAR